MKKLYIDESLCTGCEYCMIACSFAKKKIFNPRLARLRIKKVENSINNEITICYQCENPYCVTVCPENAIYKLKENGIVVIDEEKCTGCGICAQYCPWQMIKIDVERKKVEKCDLCEGEPACVKQCPTGAIRLISL